MAATYFTVDGQGTFTPGHVVEPTAPDLSGAPEDLAAEARAFLGERLSAHGRVALMEHHDYVADATYEVVLELTRRDVAPAAQSRISGLFAFCSITDAQQFRDRHRDPANGIFAVEGPEDAHRGDARLLGIATSPLVSALYARWYWQGRPNPLGEPLWEVLLALPVTIGERVA